MYVQKDNSCKTVALHNSFYLSHMIHLVNDLVLCYRGFQLGKLIGKDSTSMST